MAGSISRGRNKMAEDVKHPKEIALLGRLSFRTSFGQNVLRHSMEVAYLTEMMAEELGLNGRLARRCGLLHDIGKAADHEMEGTHPEIGLALAKRYNEPEEVLNAIAGHHGDIAATNLYTPLVAAANNFGILPCGNPVSKFC